MIRTVVARIRRHIGLVSALVLTIVIGMFVGPRVVLGPRIIVEPIVQQDFVQTVVASGRVETPHRVDVGVQITGTVQRVPVREGQSVASGATLIELEPSELHAALLQAERAVQYAAAKQRQLREVQAPAAAQAMRQAQLAHDAAVDAWKRSSTLFAAGAISQSEMDVARRGEQSAAAQLQTAQQAVVSAMPSGSDDAASSATLAQAQAGAALARAKLDYTTVRAPIVGVLIARDVEPGDVVQPGRVLMVLSPAGETQLVVQIDEKNLRLLTIGLTAVASADAYPTKRFAADVVYINPSVDAQRGAVEVKLHVASPPAYLKQDMTVSVDIQIATRPYAILVPGDAVHDIDTNVPWVLVVDGGHVRKRRIMLGLRSTGVCEVRSGLVAGDRVVPVATANVVDGARIRPTAASASTSTSTSTSTAP